MKRVDEAAAVGDTDDHQVQPDEYRSVVRSTLAWIVVWIVASWGPVDAQQLAVRSYTALETEQLQVWSLCHDSRGYLWVGTSTGLFRWDGVSFQVFTEADGLHSTTIRTIVEDREGRLWLGTEEGVVRFDGRRFTVLGAEQGLCQGLVWCSARDQRGAIWFGTYDEGVSVACAGGYASFTTEHGLASSYVYSLLPDRQGRLWLGHGGEGVTRCRVDGTGQVPTLSDCRVFSTTDGLAHGMVRAIVEDKRGHIWFGTRGGGISRWDGTGFASFTRDHGLAADDIYSMISNDTTDQLVIGTYRSGISICDLPQLACRSYGMRNGLPDDAVMSMTTDLDRTLWVGHAAGLSQLLTEDVETYTLRDGLPHRTIFSVWVDPDGTIWAGTLAGLARVRRDPLRSEPAQVEGWPSEGLLPGYEVWEVRRDRAGRLWVATEQGLCQFAEGRCQTVLTAEDGLADSDLYTVFPASDGSVWVGTVSGATRLRIPAAGGPPQTMTLTEEDGLGGASVRYITEDAAGAIWMITGSNLSRWHSQRLRTYTSADGLPAEEIQDISATADGRVWVGSSSGLIEIRMSAEEAQFVHHGSQRGVHGPVSSLFAPGDGTLWLGTGDGVLHYDPDAPIGDAVLDLLDTSSGMPSIEVFRLARDRWGTLWVGTSGGLVRVDIRRRQRSPRPPAVILERARTLTGLEWRSPFTVPSAQQQPEVHWFTAEPLPLPHDFAALRLEFRALAFGPHETSFQTRLDGFDRRWSEPFTAPFKEYTNLDPGSYTLRLRAAAGNSGWGHATTLSFDVVPAWWQTTWARIGGVLGLLALVVSGVSLRTASIRRRAGELERAVAERTDDLRRYSRALEEHSRALDRANIRIRQADRVKSEFLANMSHELRTPLNSIIGFSEVLARRLADRLESRELRFLRNVGRSGRYLLLLINNLLDLSKIEADRMDVHLEEVELGPLIEETLQVVQGYASDRSVAVQLTQGPEPSKVRVDIAKLNQILINLLSNAVKFSSPGDTVEVEVRPLSEDASALGVPSYELVVTDHGPGIREEDRTVIFETFRQAGGGSAHPGGTGLGLALVQRFVILLGGRVDFDSVLGEGTTFRVLLPIHPSRHASAVDDSQPGLMPDEPLSRPSVLVVERDRLHFAALAEALEDRGLLPVRAGDVDETRRMIQGLRPVALVVLWDETVARDWTSFASLLASPDALPAVHAASSGGVLSIPLAADRCLLHPVQADTLLAAIEALGIEAGGKVLVAGGEDSSRQTLQEDLTRHGYEVFLLHGGEVAPAALQPALVVLDLAGPDAADSLLASRLAKHRTPRVVLLPEKHPPAIRVPPGSGVFSVDELARKVRELLTRKAQRPSWRLTGQTDLQQ